MHQEHYHCYTDTRCQPACYSPVAPFRSTLSYGRCNRLLMRLRRGLALLAPRLLRALLLFATEPLTLSTFPFGGVAFALFAPRLLLAFPCGTTVHLGFGLPSLLALGMLSFGVFPAGLELPQGCVYEPLAHPSFFGRCCVAHEDALAQHERLEAAICPASEFGPDLTHIFSPLSLFGVGSFPVRTRVPEWIVCHILGSIPRLRQERCVILSSLLPIAKDSVRAVDLRHTRASGRIVPVAIGVMRERQALEGSSDIGG